jgi:integrase
MIFLGFYFALRIGEVRLLEREAFRLLERGKVFIRTLKVTQKILHRCSKCEKEVRLAMRRKGTLFTCASCGAQAKVKNPGKGQTERPEGSPPVVEPHVRKYVLSYLQTIPDTQDTLFVSRNGNRLCRGFISMMFSTYLERAGLSQIYSWHSLRHGRGVQLWEKFHDLVIVKNMLRHTDISSAQVYAGISPSTIDRYSDELESDAVKV